jgi:hypothetical protein
LEVAPLFLNFEGATESNPPFFLRAFFDCGGIDFLPMRLRCRDYAFRRNSTAMRVTVGAQATGAGGESPGPEA